MANAAHCPDGWQRPWDGMAFAFFVCVLGLAILTFGDFGVTWDEDLHHGYGGLVLAYYRSFFADRAFLDYSDLRY